MCQADRDAFGFEQVEESKMWRGRFFIAGMYGWGIHCCIDNVLQPFLEQFLMDRIDQRMARLVDYALAEFQREFERMYPHMRIFEKIYDPLTGEATGEFRKIKSLTHEFLSVYVGPRPHDYEMHLGVLSHYD
jgi:hypothetical protein